MSNELQDWERLEHSHHKSETPSTPEKERSASTQDISLVISPVQAERAILTPENGQVVCTECGDFWGPATAIACTADSKETQVKWNNLFSKCWTNYTTCPDYYRFCDWKQYFMSERNLDKLYISFYSNPFELGSINFLNRKSLRCSTVKCSTVKIQYEEV